MRIPARHAVRVTGLLTAGFGAMSIAAPRLLAAHLHQTDVLGVAPPGLVILSRVLGVRDVGSGLAMALAPAGRPRNTAIAVRVLFDLTDTVSFTTALPDPAVRRNVAALALGWASLCAVSGLAAQRATP